MLTREGRGQTRRGGRRHQLEDGRAAAPGGALHAAGHPGDDGVYAGERCWGLSGPGLVVVRAGGWRGLARLEPGLQQDGVHAGPLPSHHPGPHLLHLRQGLPLLQVDLPVLGVGCRGRPLLALVLLVGFLEKMIHHLHLQPDVGGGQLYHGALGDGHGLQLDRGLGGRAGEEGGGRQWSVWERDPGQEGEDTATGQAGQQLPGVGGRVVVLRLLPTLCLVYLAVDQAVEVEEVRVAVEFVHWLHFEGWQH